jgi:hypothetical protein
MELHKDGKLVAQKSGETYDRKACFTFNSRLKNIMGIEKHR